MAMRTLIKRDVGTGKHGDTEFWDTEILGCGDAGIFPQVSGFPNPKFPHLHVPASRSYVG